MRLKFIFITLAVFLGLTFAQHQPSKSNTNTRIAGLRPKCLCADTLSLHALAATDVANDIQAAQKALKIDSIFEKRYLNAHFNGAVLVAQQGVIIYNKAYGKQDFNSMADNNTFSKFQLASASKTFTAIAVLWLYERGKIDLNDVVRKYYPEFPYTDVLIKDLLSHRSGIPNYMYVFGDSARRLQPAHPTNQDIMRWFAHGQPRAYTQPDVRFAYNNSNYAVLAAIIEKISGLSFDEFLRKNIFLPLNMHDTFVITTTNDSINRNRTFGYTNTQQPIPTDTWDGVTGDKGVYSTTNDLYKWYKALHSSCLLKPETLQMAFEPRSFEQNGTRNYGYGFRLKTNSSGNNYIYHNGWWKGYNATFGFSPTDDYVIIVLSNRLNRTVYDVQPIINILTGQTQPTTNYNAANPSARNSPSSISSEENEGAGFE